MYEDIDLDIGDVMDYSEVNDYDFENDEEFADAVADDIQFMDEFKSRERAGGRMRGGTEGAGGLLQELGRKGQKDSEDYYQAQKEISIKKFEDVLKLSEDLQIKIGDAYYTLNKPNYKNMDCLILGLWVLDSNKKIDKSKINKIKNLLKKEENYTLEDVIRYARLWMRE